LKYVLVGSGGTGTHVLHPLIAYLTSREDSFDLAVIDGDTVEKHNLMRQLFTPINVMQNKAQSAVEPFGYLPNVRAIPEYLGKANIGYIVEEGSIVLIAADNFTIRFLIQEHAQGLQNCVVINGGNEFDTGSCQIYIRQNGENITPPLSFLHPEVEEADSDRAELSCQQIAALPSGGQLITTNMASALWMLQTLMDYHDGKYTNGENAPTEIQFDLGAKKEVIGMDFRIRSGWST
jgi:molybdopterin/thiamine biosynthesis adenylyltransferase